MMLKITQIAIEITMNVVFAKVSCMKMNVVAQPYSTDSGIVPILIRQVILLNLILLTCLGSISNMTDHQIPKE